MRRLFSLYFLIVVWTRDFKYISWGNIVALFQEWETEFGDVVTLTDTNDKYKVPAAGTCKDSSGKDVPCKVYALEITEKSTLPKDNSRPAVFFSGAVHGNEMPGVIAVVEFARFLLENYKKKEAGNDWLKYLVQNRRIILVPTLNSWGYANQRRDEVGIDPNRDFPYDQQPAKCMQSVTARIANELFLENIFMTGLTFHGGTTSISHEWGDFFHNNPRTHSQSPDHNAMNQIADCLSKYAGKDEKGRMFPYKTINQAVYPVNGGMEDWAYGASWMNQFESSASKPCNPGTNGGYSSEKTTYKDSHFRSIFMLVETHDRKKPQESILGNSDKMLRPGNIGLVSRLIRQMLLMTDVAQPYVKIHTINNSSSGIIVHWNVMGAFNVDETYAIAVDDSGKEYRSKTSSGLTVWGGDPNRDPSHFHRKYLFSGRIQIPNGLAVQVRAFAKVDSFWAKERKNFPGGPQVRPQSHLVNARTNENWDHTLPNSHVQGTIWWESEVKDWIFQKSNLPENKDPEKLREDPESPKLLPTAEKHTPEKIWESDLKPATAKHRQVPSFKPFGHFLMYFIMISCLIFAGLQFFTTQNRYRYRSSRTGPDTEDQPFRNIELGVTKTRR